MAYLSRKSHAVQLLMGGILLAEVPTMAEALALLESLSLTHSVQF